MSDGCRKRRSSFFQKPVEGISNLIQTLINSNNVYIQLLTILECTEKQLELFEGMDWVLAEKEDITSKSVLFGGQGKKQLQE